ncbi:proprotein convertase P-domain-containing protein [Dyella silvatica]|uniref:proprotein convertase P-domain-containing protein n=1 Tax=Dyella silvatica TaxID=2992128 RepID=UPI00225C369E|nr:proprotein convertase P-domain-containing protein [Dyella silvatica]
MIRSISKVSPLTTALALLGLLGAGGAYAQATNASAPAKDYSYRHGVIHSANVVQQNRVRQASRAAAGVAAAATKLSYGGGDANGNGVTSGKPQVYLVVYGSQWGDLTTDATSGIVSLTHDADGAVPYLQKFFKGLGTGGELWSGTMTQYCDGANVAKGATSCSADASHVGYPTDGAYAGIWYDNSAAAPDSPTSADLANEAVAAAKHFGNNTPASNRYVQYVVLSPSGTHPDGFNTDWTNTNLQWCAWHSSTNDADLGAVAYTNMPYMNDAPMGQSFGYCGKNYVNGKAGLLDGFSIVNGHEYAETITDQYFAGGGLGWTVGGNSETENGDLCAWISSGQGASANMQDDQGSFAVQSTWSNDTAQCEIAHPIIQDAGGASTFSNSTAQSIADNATVSSTITVAGRSGKAPTALKVHVSITHNWSGDLTIELIAPDGTVNVLQSPDYNDDGNIDQTYTVDASSSAANGQWQLKVIDDDGGAPGDSGTLNSWSLAF